MKLKLLPLLISSILSSGYAVAIDTSQAMINGDASSLRQSGQQVENKEFGIKTIFDRGVELDWESGYISSTIILTEKDVEGRRVYENARPGFYIGDLKPNTTYVATLNFCDANGNCMFDALRFDTPDEVLGYNDSRKEKNHLAGELQANVRFAQTHTSVMPNGNEEKNRPNLVMERDALLLVTPTIEDVHHLELEILQEGVVVERVNMIPPSAQFDTDQPDNGREKVIFSHYAWSAPISWQWMTPGMSLRFVDSKGREGLLAENEIVFGGAPELVIQNIDIGMLTERRNSYQMINDMPTLAADYFQKIPVSKLVIADYTPFQLDKVTLPNGKVYTEKSDDIGGVYEGDMRENIGKALVSTGINNANYGIVDTAGSSQSWNRRFNHITAHNNRGVYSNGQTNHGLSGGGGIVTLIDSIGNEWSHELGHNYGRGHWPKGVSIHDMETGWGWDANYQRFIGNLHWTGEATTTVVEQADQSVEPFMDAFRFTRDTMAGGESMRIGLISRYTLEHPAGTRQTQNFLNQSNNLDLTSETGYARWDQEQQNYVSADVDHAIPLEKGVPVITLLGIYDPMNTNPSQIYPLIYSNYGNVYDLPEPATSDMQLEGWQPVANLSEADRAATTWQTMKVDDQQQPLCQFSYTNGKGETANFVGYEDREQNTCQTTPEMYWLTDGVQERPVSAEGDYQLLSAKNSLTSVVTYRPTEELGVHNLCSMDKSGTAHDGAGYLSNGKCQQIPDVKHSNGANWSYATHQGGIRSYAFESQSQCQLTVEKESGDVQQIALSPSRISSNQSNKFHVNLPADDHPSRVSVSCTIPGEEELVLDSAITERNPAVDELMGPVIIGQEHGYSAVVTDVKGGWFEHKEGFTPDNLAKFDKSRMATMLVGSERPYVCRFPMTIHGSEKTLHGYVESLGGTDFRCTGGTEISVQDDQGTRPVLSEVNGFEWLSLNNKNKVGERVNAIEGQDADLCTLTKGGEWYGAGFLNSSGQCVQVEGVYWSNGRHWLFSSGHGSYAYQ
ncbi:M66 family metalloprotease [Parendozoicomonas haliclonae]|uniref:Metalloprotease StcE n=1 Tax=Parendozoicomonas haliclonae TaxID=1960125 RepID=A0A1X7AMP0_9GAMM|nr:M66 family metalloprotease [Parendozoicomonas haliclonae]SMA49566.1 Metalloprotease StcE precursor [Parendozoicomonas haliclonae]